MLCLLEAMRPYVSRRRETVILWRRYNTLFARPGPDLDEQLETCMKESVRLLDFSAIVMRSRVLQHIDHQWKLRVYFGVCWEAPARYRSHCLAVIGRRLGGTLLDPPRCHWCTDCSSARDQSSSQQCLKKLSSGATGSRCTFCSRSSNAT